MSHPGCCAIAYFWVAAFDMEWLGCGGGGVVDFFQTRQRVLPSSTSFNFLETNRAVRNFLRLGDNAAMSGNLRRKM
jgi:hypothetical protein